MNKISKYLIGALLVFFLCNNVHSGIDDGLVAHFKFDGDIADSSPRNLSGAVHGALTYEQGVVGDYAARFDGSTVVTFTDYFYFIQSPGSINFFINPDVAMDYSCMLWHSYINFGIASGYNGASRTYGYNDHWGFFPVTPGQWTMITYVYPANYGTVKIYKNGDFVYETPANTLNNGYLGQWYHGQPYNSVIGAGVGALSDYANSSYMGLMDDLRFYNRILSEAEIQELYTEDQPNSHTLTITKSGTGSGTVTSSPSGINCGSTCSSSFPSGTPVTLTPAAAPGSYFAGWTGCDSTSGNTCTVAMSANKSVTARFDPAEYTLITLKSFTARYYGGKTFLQWRTASEFENAGFFLVRSEDKNGKYERINSTMVEAKGTPVRGAAYLYTDKDVQRKKTYYYKLEDVDTHGKSTFHGPVQVTVR